MTQEKTPFETVDVCSPDFTPPSTFGFQQARHPSIAKWPTEPRPLKTSIWSKTVYTFLDLLMCLAPIVLLIKEGHWSDRKARRPSKCFDLEFDSIQYTGM